MHAPKRLRGQVVTELKRRRYVFFTLVLLSFLYLGFTLVFSEMGLLRYIELKEKKASIQRDLIKVTEENERLEASIRDFTNDDFYVEKHAREDFGLSNPDEYIFIFK